MHNIALLKALSHNKLITVATHVLVWTVFGLAIYYYQPILSDVEIPVQFWLKQTAALLLLVALFYLNTLLLVPALLLKGRQLAYVVMVGGLVLAVVFTTRALDRAYGDFQMRRSVGLSRTQGVPGPPLIQPFRRGISGNMLTLVMSLMVVGIGTTMTAVARAQQDRMEREALEKDKVATELSFLKNQINPHFYFNTLNNIYALTEVDPKLAGEAILQLSKMMRHLLYGAQRDETMLSQEIAFVRNYIALMKLRLTDKVELALELPAELQDMPLAPLILLPFVENAFKHGVSTTRPSHVSIRITQREKMLDVQVDNSIIPENAISLEDSGGIGLANTRRRLDLLYPGKYKLDAGADEAGLEYSVHLELDLS